MINIHQSNSSELVSDVIKQKKYARKIMELPGKEDHTHADAVLTYGNCTVISDI